MNLLKFIQLTFLFIICDITYLFAQESITTDSLAKSISALKAEIQVLRNVKVSGYVQVQAQIADTVGAQTDMQAGKFPENTNNRFKIRRGRLKVAYRSNHLSHMVVQFDVSESGVKAKEIYAKITDPFVSYFTLTAGLQNRPYGFEIEYSSTLFESPERSRTEQSLFKDEYDLGANLTMQAPNTSKWHFLKVDVGIFTGSIENKDPMDYKKRKDLFGRINMSKAFMNNTLKLSGGVSYCMGAAPTTNSFFEVKNGVFVKDTCAYGTNISRQFFGADFQISYKAPLGLTTLRAEYTKGQQPSTATAITNPTALGTVLYKRKIEGYYVMLVQNVLKTRHSFVVRYDVFDPNTESNGVHLKAASQYTSTDIKWANLGIGYNCQLDSNTKLVLYYDINTNESTGLVGYSKDLKDNVWTIRLQYRF